jgi:hypothetical protein
MQLTELKLINEMAAASPWTTFVRNLIVTNPNITDAAINALVSQNGITPPNFLKVRLDGLRKSIADQAAKHGGVTPTAKVAKTTTSNTPPTTASPKLVKAIPPTTPTPLASNGTDHILKISAWLDSHEVKNYTINSDTYVVDVDGDVHLDRFYHTKLPIKFGKVNGDFYIAAAGISSLQGCPDFVDGRFACQNNKSLKSAIGSPQIVMGSADYENCPLVNIDGLPKEIHGDLDLQGTKITSFTGIHKQIKTLDGNLNLGKMVNKITDSIAGLLLLRKLQKITMDWESKQTSAGKALEIVNKHLEGDRLVTECQLELQDAGFDKFAKM